MQGVVLFYTAAVGFACGIFVRSFVEVGLSEIVFILVLSFVLGVIWRRRPEESAAPYLRGFSILFFLLALGIFRFEYASWSEAHPAFETKLGSEVELIGTVVREPDERESSTHLYIETKDELLLVLADPYGEFAYGDEVIVTGILARPESFETDLGRTFNYPGYLQARGVSYMIKYAKISVVGSGGNPVFASLFIAKHAFMERLERILPEPHVGLGEGLLLGVKRALGDELETTFRKTGIIHIVVLSGYNLMLVVAFVTYILGAVLPKRFMLPCGILGIASFALMVGLSATVVRASVMAVLLLTAQALNRTYLVLRALVFAGTLMLLINPYLLAFDTGFQLSFLATLGLIVLAPHVESLFHFIPNFIGIRGFLAATLATQIFVLPILLYQIGEFSVVAVLVNILVLPMVPITMLLTFLIGIVGFLSLPLASLFASVAYWSLEYILRVATLFGALPFASFAVPAFPLLLVVISYVALGVLLYLLQKKVSTEPDELSGWVIEEEEEVWKRVAAESRLPAQAGSDSAATDVPVFFKKDIY